MIDAGNRGTGGRRYALPAFFALTLVAAITLTLALTTEDSPKPDVATAALPAVSVSSAKPADPGNEAPPVSRERERLLLLELERALVSNNPQERETALNFSLPELLDLDPARVTELVARQQGETRDVLREEVVRHWIRKDREAAMIWMGSLVDDDRKSAATTAMRTLAAIEPAQAVAVADQFGIGRDDGSLEHIVQIWATENFDDCEKWLEKQPDNAQTAQLRARVEQVREQRLTASQ